MMKPCSFWGSLEKDCDWGFVDGARLLGILQVWIDASRDRRLIDLGCDRSGPDYRHLLSGLMESWSSSDGSLLVCPVT